jgi:hypothetical protein
MQGRHCPPSRRRIRRPAPPVLSRPGRSLARQRAFPSRSWGTGGKENGGRRPPYIGSPRLSNLCPIPAALKFVISPTILYNFFCQDLIARKGGACAWQVCKSNT